MRPAAASSFRRELYAGPHGDEDFDGFIEEEWQFVDDIPDDDDDDDDDDDPPPKPNYCFNDDDDDDDWDDDDEDWDDDEDDEEEDDDEEEEDWDDDWHPCLNVNDFFAPAADAERIPDKDIDRHLDTLIELGKRFGYMGHLAWTSMRRKEMGPWKGLEYYKPEDVAKFEAAKAWLKETGLFTD